ncbi:hypothetical protein JNUCC1_01322 [Lentibacillus sp. JNUCC-1]|uniref:DUF4350 domain-containing protein n=1 Tax=Lentibacillus sp. JNUCC-1 TaxID=2654513 RepID=UPI0012E86455|nr:DUF4350 domain-containing protein [Lentibacillus sp. JNUCC-1]MUV37516.1 hypothetical protein [Lentibacillus sp. JNUCC-1]
MKTALADKKGWLWIAGLLIVLIGVGYLTKSDQPKPYPPYTLDSPAPDGIKGFYTYLKDTSADVAEWRSSPEKLSSRKNSKDELLVMTQPPYIEESQVEEAYLDYIKNGHTVLMLMSNPDGMLGIKTELMPLDPETVVKDHQEQDHEAVINSMVRLRAEQDDEVLLSDDDGVIGLKRSVGEGTLIAINAPNWMTNEEILEHDHLPLVLDIFAEAGAGESQILFDTSSGRTATGGRLIDVFPDWIVALSILALVWTVFWLLYQGKRFGRVVTPREATVRFSDERIRALGAWYLRGQQYPDAVAIQADFLKFLLQERWGFHTDIHGMTLLTCW